MNKTYRNRFFKIFIFGSAVCFYSLLPGCGNPGKPKNDVPVTVSADTNSSVKAIADLSVKINSNPNNASLLHQRAKLYIAAKNLQPALEDMNRVMKIDTITPVYFITLADLYFAMNKTGNSKAALEKCISIDPKNTEAFLKLAELYLFVDNNKKSVSYIDEALKIDPHISKAYFMKGMNFKALKDTEKAVSSFRTAIDQEPKYYDAYIQLGLIFSNRNDNIAAQYLSSALAIRPNSQEALYARAMFYQNTEEWDKAIRDYTTLTQLNPKYKFAYYNLGYIHLINLKVYNEAIKHFSAAIYCDSTYAEAYYMRGLSYETLGNIGEAARDYNNALRIKPEYDLAKKGIERVR